MNGLVGVFRMFAGSLEALRRAAMTGDVAAQYRLGRMYEAGRRVERNVEEAALWYQRAADRGHAEAQFRLGRMYHEGRGLDRDSKKAERWLRLAAEQGVAEARRYLDAPEGTLDPAPATEPAKENRRRPNFLLLVGVVLFNVMFSIIILMLPWRGHQSAAERIIAAVQNGVGQLYAKGGVLPKSEERAREWFRKAAERGDSDAQNRLNAVAQLQAAERGDAEAQYKVAGLYAFGLHGLNEDYAQAARWCRKAAEQGHKDAQYLLGRFYYKGRVMPRDDAQALAWFRKAAEQGHEEAQKLLAGLELLLEDWDKRPPWLEMLLREAERGDADALDSLFRLGYSLERGDFWSDQNIQFPQNYEQAMRWHRKAADLGHAGSQYRLGLLYKTGRGSKRDDGQAAVWFRKAAEQGNPGAQYRLGQMYEEGKGVDKDPARAIEWYRKSAAQGLRDAQLKLMQMESAPAGAERKTE